jgi:hypothetical protein
MDNAAGVSRRGEIMPIDQTFSQICNQVRSLPQTRGLRLVKGELATRNGSGLELHRLGRLLNQSKAVKQIEKSIDQELGLGEGKKLLKAMGGVYQLFGARITPEQVIAVETRINERLKERIQSGEQVRFSLLPTDLKYVSDCIREDFAAAREASQMDPGFETDGTRQEIVIEADGVKRNLSHEASAKFDNEEERLAYIVEALKQHVRDERDDDATNDRRFIFLTTFLSQRLIGPAYVPTIRLLGGDVGGDNKKTAELDRGTSFKIYKVRGDNGQNLIKLDCGCTKENLEWIDVGGIARKLVKESSNLYLNIRIEVSSEDLGKGHAEGVMVGPVEVSVQLTRDRSS